MKGLAIATLLACIIITLSCAEAKPIYISAHALYYAYADNEINADQLYKSKKLQVEGKVALIGKLDDTAYIMLYADSGLGGIQCNFSKKYESQIAKVKIDETVIILGTCKGFVGRVIILNITVAKHVVLENCQIAE